MLFAAHISDGVLAPAWQLAGFGLAAVMAFLGAWRLRDEEIPRIALMTAAFFISSQMHIRLGPTSVHLLLVGLVGITLGPRAALAVPIGLALQFFLFHHGGFWSLGVNACVMEIPALAAWITFRALHRFSWWREPWFRAVVTAICGFLALSALDFGLTLAVVNFGLHVQDWDTSLPLELILHPLALIAGLAIAGLLGWLERYSQAAPEFTLGFLLGGGAVLLTTALNYCALVFLGGEEPSRQGFAFLQVVAHLPLVPVEGLIVGSIVAFVAKVKPEMLGAD